MIEDASSSPLTQDRRRAALFLFACFYTFLFVGAFFGWGPMQLLLEENGNFHSKCAPQEGVCPEQTSALINVQLIGQVLQITAPAMGQIADHFGAPVLAHCMLCFCWIGIFLLVIASAYGPDYLLYIAFAFLGLTSIAGGLLTVQTGMYFSGQTRSRVIFVLNSLFDAGSITYLAMWGIAETTGASLTALSVGYLVLALFVFGGGAYLWSVTIPSEGTQEFKDSTHDPEGHGENGIEAASNALPESDKASGPYLDDPVSSNDPSSSAANAASDTKYVVVADRTVSGQLHSRPFLLLLLFWTIHVTANQWTLTTTRAFLAYLGDDETGNKYLTIFTLLLPASLAAVPFADYMLLRYGFMGGFHCINVLYLAYWLIRLCSDNLNVQILGFLLFSFFRSFLFGVTFSFLPTVLAGTVLGKASGIMLAVTGVTAFMNIPLAKITVEDNGGNFFIPNLIYTLLVVPCFIVVWDLGRAVALDGVGKAERSEQGSVHPKQESNRDQ